nr:integrase, catalytic region, zinc finger, CCHC-type, peptidase aspartic, catalytic [Tanacetum cinerariifolium]
MANLLEDIQCASSDTRPPMIDRTDFTSWKQHIRLYFHGKENGVNILKLINEGPFQMGTFRETLAEGDEGAFYLGPKRPRVYSNLSLEEKERNQATVQDGRVVVQIVQGRLNRGQGNNARGTGQIARSCTQPKQPQNLEYFKDMMLLMQAQENGVSLDEEQLLLIAGRQDNVDEQLVQDLALNVYDVF